MELGALLESLLLQFLSSLVRHGVEFVAKKVVDAVNGVVTKIVATFNGKEYDVYTLNTLIPDIGDGCCLVDKDGEIGVGLPEFEFVAREIDVTSDSETLYPSIGIDNGDTFTGYPGGGIVAPDGKVYVPFDDIDGDGLRDWALVVDDNGDGLPDASDDSPFYPIGSDEFQQVVGGYSDDAFLSKPISEYTVTEGILLIFLIVLVIRGFKNFFLKHRKVHILK
ncbi:MAG: hypothetical protein NC299_09755 [Lachnospiraceae bacterium]|nr:hypothetical protein [Ruminococcus sp.]MCM1275638.1 hypothetical protein [Lachnospiraceae bacterium]